MNDSNGIAKDICQFLRDFYPQPTPALGSYIGALLQKQFAEVNLKVAFGGLRSFFLLHLADYVTEIGRRGSDVEYFIDFTKPRRSENVAQTNYPNVAPRLEDRSASSHAAVKSKSYVVNPWSALTNPRSTIRAAWNERLQKLVLMAPDESPSQIQQELPPLTYQEHCLITQEFLRSRGIEISIEEANPDEFQAYVPKVVKLLKERGLHSEWERYRIEKILKFLGERLMGMGATAQTVQEILSDIRASKPQPHATTLPARNAQDRGHDPNMTDDSEKRLRAFIARAVEHMSMAELREIKISGLALEKTLTSS